MGEGLLPWYDKDGRLKHHYRHGGVQRRAAAKKNKL